MNKLFGLFFLALACWAPDIAQAASRFLTCATTCTITAADTSIWGTTTGGTGASVPGSSDDVILDAATCVGGTTCTATFGAGYNPTWISLTMSLCTASTAGCILDASVNNNNIVLTGSTAYTNSGSGTRTLNMGNGTWTLSGNGAIWNIAASATLNAGSSTLAFTGSGGTSGRRDLLGGGKTYSTVTISGSTGAAFRIQSQNTFGTLTIAGPNRFFLGGGGTQTVTTMTNVAASSSNPVLFTTDTPATGVATISSANNWTCDWCGFTFMTFSGGGTFSATNSLNFGANTGITISPPSGGGGGRIIGG